jgi:hypothetical protein
MNWSKLGRIFCPDNHSSWMNSYASYPWAVNQSGNDFRIYFSTRDVNNVSRIGFVDIDLLSPLKIKRISERPELDIGEIGTFDYNGVSISSICETEKGKYLYYLGWNILRDIPWRNTIGLSIQKNSDSGFERYCKGPIVGIDRIDPFTLTYPCVLHDEGYFKMWYGSSLYWGPEVKDTLHVIKYAVSDDGINWKKSEKICVRPYLPGEYAVVKPMVLKDGDFYRMWYSYRVNEQYLLGYAESLNGEDWQRMDQMNGIKPSNKGWDCKMICYPQVFKHKEELYMLYNGNSFGKSGFGLAKLER